MGNLFSTDDKDQTEQTGGRKKKHKRPKSVYGGAKKIYKYKHNGHSHKTQKALKTCRK